MPQKELPTTSYAVLGLLSFGPKSGYELVNFAEQSIANFWTIAKSQIYRELARLEELGYVRGTDVRQQKVPDKRTYQLTKQGLSELKAWLVNTEIEQDRIRSPFLVKVFFGHLIDHDGLVGMVKSYGNNAKAALEHFGPMVDQLGEVPNATFMYSTALLGRKMLEAMGEWSEEAVRLFQRRKKGKGVKAK